MSETKNLLNRIISKSFPHLVDCIKIIQVPQGVFWWATAFTFRRSIFLNSSFNRMDPKSKKALLMHELCHIDSSINKTLPKEIFDSITECLSWAINTKMSREVERSTDIAVIKKGYGQELLHLAEMRKKNFSKEKLKKIHTRGYLNSKEIKSLIKKYSKK